MLIHEKATAPTPPPVPGRFCFTANSPVMCIAKSTVVLSCPVLRIPTVFCPSGDDNCPPVSLRLDFAERNFLVVLADDRLSIDET